MALVKTCVPFITICLAATGPSIAPTDYGQVVWGQERLLLLPQGQVGGVHLAPLP